MANIDRAEIPRRVAVLDLGSNTVLLLILDREGRALQDHAKITRLGEGVFERGRLLPEAWRRTREAVVELAERARAESARPLVAVGTEALRRAEDGREFLDEVARAARLDRAWLLTGQQEAELALEATRRAASPGESALVIDVGGGSTELARLDTSGHAQGTSLPLGSVRLTEACVDRHPIPADQLERLRQTVRRELASLTPMAASGTSLTAVAGTATTLAALDQELEPYDPERVEGYRVGRERLAAWIERLAVLDLEQRCQLPGLEPGRADVIVAGLVILDELLGALGASSLRISGRGVRHGVALRLLDGRNPV